MIGPLPYIGGKTRLAAEIIAMLPSHTTYVEAFAGGAQVFFRKEPSRVEVLNDLDGELVNFLRVCQWHHEELIRYLRYMVAARRWHGLLKASDPAALTDIQRAGRTLFLQKTSFGGLIRKRHYHYCVTQPPNFNPSRIPATIEQAHRRLIRVQLENLPYEQVLKRYDRPTTLFYLDPPYFQRKLYRFNLEDAEFVAMRDRLRSLKGRFILSLNDHAEVHRIFAEFRIRRTAIRYSAQRRPEKQYGELLICNFD
ncbi:MAG: DNA adenine methylase [Bryobacteraceae bacterium]|nr:DNA adenine methylase [Bryobacteraceae bacterium]